MIGLWDSSDGFGKIRQFFKEYETNLETIIRNWRVAGLWDLDDYS